MDQGEPGWLFQQPELHSRRGPGTTCLSALRDMKFTGMPAENTRKGCGRVMRIAPVGLFAWRMDARHEPEPAFELGAELAAITHGHPTGSLAAGVMAVLVMALTDGASLPEALAVAKPVLEAQTGCKETRDAIAKAEELAASSVPPEQAIARLARAGSPTKRWRLPSIARWWPAISTTA
jgi:ADP-ribosylglycohydrolase